MPTLADEAYVEIIEVDAKIERFQNKIRSVRFALLQCGTHRLEEVFGAGDAATTPALDATLSNLRDARQCILNAFHALSNLEQFASNFKAMLCEMTAARSVHNSVKKVSDLVAIMKVAFDAHELNVDHLYQVALKMPKQIGALKIIFAWYAVHHAACAGNAVVLQGFPKVHGKGYFKRVVGEDFHRIVADYHDDWLGNVCNASYHLKSR